MRHDVRMSRSQSQFGQKLAAIPGYVSSPYEKASLEARPPALAPARIVALAVLEKVVVEDDTKAAFISFATRLV